MKKTIIMLLAVMMLFAFTACNNGTPRPGDELTLDDNATMANGTVNFKNSDSTVLSKVSGNNYKVTGVLAKMNAAQATAWGTVEGSQYVALEIPTGVDATTRRGWVSAADAAKSELDDSAFKVMNDSKVLSKDDATWGMILAVTTGDTPRTDIEGNYVWRVEITEDGKDTVIYTVDMSAYFTE